MKASHRGRGDPNGVQKVGGQILESAKAATKEATSVKLAAVTDSDGTEVRTICRWGDAGSQGTLGQPGRRVGRS